MSVYTYLCFRSPKNPGKGDNLNEIPTLLARSFSRSPKYRSLLAFVSSPTISAIDLFFDSSIAERRLGVLAGCFVPEHTQLAGDG